MSWTDERKEIVKKLWADGLSASHIAGEIGGVSRNAVIGVVHRMGLSGRAKSPASYGPRKPRALRATAASVPRIMRARLEAGIAALPPLEEDETYIVPIEQRCTLLDLNENTCRWPIGDPAIPGFFFCGGKSLEGLPYCNYHSRAAYQPANERRRRTGYTWRAAKKAAA